MLKRVRWFGLGVVAGSAASVYGIARLREAQQRFVDPDQLIDTVGSGVRSVSRAVAGTVRDAWDESRVAISESEDDLTRSYLTRRPHLRP